MIGLLTIHDTMNFGSQLQTYSLYKAVESLGCDVRLIDYQCEAIAARETTLPLKEARSPKDVLKSLILHGNLQKRQNSFHQFMAENMKLTERYTRATVARTNELFDCFLVGSDIVWGFNITGKDYTYMLDFVEDAKRYAFSSSVGTKWKKEDEGKIREYLGKFDDISVRESDAAEWISNLLGKEIKVTCDPTMLWDADFWKKTAGRSVETKKPYVLVYMSDTENVCIHRAIAYGKKQNMPVYYINFRAPVFGTLDKRPTSLAEWLDLFIHADTIFSASYHGLLFATYFHKRFFYFNWVNKSRMNSLAKALQIESREGTEENIEKDLPVDFEFVDKKLQSIRDNSWEILRGMVL